MSSIFNIRHLPLRFDTFFKSSVGGREPMLAFFSLRDVWGGTWALEEEACGAACSLEDSLSILCRFFLLLPFDESLAELATALLLLLLLL